LLEGVGRDPGIIGEGLERGDEAVAPEKCHEPGHSGREEGFAVLAGEEHLKVVKAALKDVIEEGVVRLHRHPVPGTWLGAA